MIIINRKEQELIDEVIENFNFKSCRKMMSLMNWEWDRYGTYILFAYMLKI